MYVYVSLCTLSMNAAQVHRVKRTPEGEKQALTFWRDRRRCARLIALRLAVLDRRPVQWHVSKAVCIQSTKGRRGCCYSDARNVATLPMAS